MRLTSHSLRQERERTVMQRLAMNEMTTIRWSFWDDVTAYRNAGYEAIGVWRPKLVEFGEERGADLLAESGLSVASLSWAGGFTGSDGHSFEDAVCDARDALQLAGRIQAACLVLVTGARGGHTQNHARRLVVDAVRELADQAADENVQLALQPMHAKFARGWTLATTLDQLLDIVDRCNHPHVGIAFDAYHLNVDPELLLRIPQFVHLVKTVQLGDWRDGRPAPQPLRLIGEGALPLGELIAGFEDAGYMGFYDLQILSESVWQSNYNDVLEQCSLEFQSCVYAPWSK